MEGRWEGWWWWWWGEGIEREEWREGGKEGGREGGRKERREGGMEGGWEGKRGWGSVPVVPAGAMRITQRDSSLMHARLRASERASLREVGRLEREVFL